MKKCFKCRLTFPLKYFHKHKEMRDGHLNKCINCVRRYVSEYRARNVEKIKVYNKSREYRLKSKQQLKLDFKEHCDFNPMLSDSSYYSATSDETLKWVIGNKTKILILLNGLKYRESDETTT